MAQHGTLPLTDVSSQPMALGPADHARSVEESREHRVTRHASRPALQNGGSGASDRARLSDGAVAPLVRYEDRERASPRRRERYTPPQLVARAIADAHNVRRSLAADMDESVSGNTMERTDSLAITDVERRDMVHASAQSFSQSQAVQDPQML